MTTPAEREIDRVRTDPTISAFLGACLQHAVGQMKFKATPRDLAIDAQLLADLLAARAREVEEQQP